MSEGPKELRAFRERMNERLLGAGSLDIRRFVALDARACQPGALRGRTKGRS